MSSDPPQEVFNYDYTTPWTVYSLSFSNSPSSPYRLAIGSFTETQHNSIQIIDKNSENYECKTQQEVTYPQTKILFSPDTSGAHSELFASVGDCLRIWQHETEISLKSTLVDISKKDFPPPLTSFDWNSTDLTMIGTSSIDSTCAIWDIEREEVRAKMIAHDKEAYDIAFAQGVNIFATAGGDGSVRQFDLRNLESSTVLYERQDFYPCLRLAWSKLDPNYLATIVMDSSTVVILDIRNLSGPVTQLLGHNSCVNALAWSPVSGNQLLTGSDDHQALIWEIKGQSQSSSPIYSYSIESEINNVQRSHINPDWIALAYNRGLKILKI
ncbi:unnamed protein product [Blepharisma stoltei]|uniref:Uncharacterized protein n=1 Tax=Blepharisma stoltei TaxID=1481888 RepID=A0AAU9INV9_9CILI|nr:unnamed protein product [Blepharisma stoltei]